VARQAIRRRSVLALLLASALPVGAAWALDPGELVIETPGGQHRFTIELADTPGERSRGLMYRRSMRPDHGMLFDFQVEQPLAFWMKNTPLPLDMLFIDASGNILQIAPDTEPFSETPVPSEQPVQAVLELLAGTSKKLGIAPGAVVHHPIFGNVR
jgi:uncharacterized membrane protein (UPF0127 family)